MNAVCGEFQNGEILMSLLCPSRSKNYKVTLSLSKYVVISTL